MIQEVSESWQLCIHTDRNSCNDQKKELFLVKMCGTLGSRGYFFLMDTDGSRRSRVNEAQSAEEKKIPIRKKILWNPG